MKIISHFKTITRHRHEVIKNCFRAGIGFQGLFHDLSKYTPTEFITGAKNYLGTKSPNERERQLYGYSKAWLHHKGRNRHHFEYWTDYNSKTKSIEPVEMPVKYVIEMFCDRVAASKIYKGKDYNDSSPLLYYENRGDRKYLHKNTAALLEKFLTMLSEQGEKATFEYIKKHRSSF
jgi:hypothetical protein